MPVLRLVTVCPERSRNDRALLAEALSDLDTSATAYSYGNHHKGPSLDLIGGICDPAKPINVWTYRFERSIATWANKSQPSIRYRAFDARPALVHKPMDSVAVWEVIKQADEPNSWRSRRVANRFGTGSLKSVWDNVNGRLQSHSAQVLSVFLTAHCEYSESVSQQLLSAPPNKQPSESQKTL